MKKISLLFFITLNIIFSAFAQQNNTETSMYKYKLGVDIPILGISMGSGIASYFLYKKKTPISIEEINALQPQQVNKFDRSAIYHHSKGANISSDVFYYASSLSPALLFIDKKVRNDWKYVLPMWAEVYGLTSALTLLTKELADRKRPYVYNQNLSAESKVSKSATASFFSGHTSVTAANTFFIAKVFADYHPDSKFKPLMWTGAALVPAITGLCRYGAGKHFFTDILVGYAVGATIGILVPHLHKR
jgi:hypothetical protein